MNGLRARRPCRLEHRTRVEVALRGWGRPDEHALVGLPDEREVLVDLGVHRDGTHAQPLHRTNDPPGDLAAIRDEHGLEHDASSQLPAGLLGDGPRARETSAVTLVLLVTLLAIGVGLLLGGRLAGIAQLPLHHRELLALALLLHVGAWWLGSITGIGFAIGVTAAALLAGLFCVRNLTVAGVPLMTGDWSSTSSLSRPMARCRCRWQQPSGQGSTSADSCPVRARGTGGHRPDRAGLAW